MADDAQAVEVASRGYGTAKNADRYVALQVWEQESGRASDGSEQSVAYLRKLYLFFACQFTGILLALFLFFYSRKFKCYMCGKGIATWVSGLACCAIIIIAIWVNKKYAAGSRVIYALSFIWTLAFSIFLGSFSCYFD